MEPQAGTDDRPAFEAIGSSLFPKEFQAACGYPGSLLSQRVSRFAADSEAHAFHPIPHRTTESNLPTAGANGLSLEVKQDHSGACAVGNPEKFDFPAMLQPAWLD